MEQQIASEGHKQHNTQSVTVTHNIRVCWIYIYIYYIIIYTHVSFYMTTIYTLIYIYIYIIYIYIYNIYILYITSSQACCYENQCREELNNNT